MKYFQQNLQELFQKSILNNLQSENVVTIVKLISYWYEKDQRNRDLPEWLVYKNEISDEFIDSENLIIKELANQIFDHIKKVKGVCLNDIEDRFDHLNKKFIDEALEILYREDKILVNRENMYYTLKPTLEERRNKIVEELKNYSFV